MTQTHLSRIWFMSQGCKQAPPALIGGKVLWCHPEGYFLSAKGQKLLHNFSPSSQAGVKTGDGKHTGSCYPVMRRFGGKLCHHLMAFAFYGERPLFIDLKNEKSYFGIVHHLIPDKLDYRPANLLCWLTREQHTEADRRQRAIKRAVGIEGMREIGYEQLRKYQDPRVTPVADFEYWCNKFKQNEL